MTNTNVDLDELERRYQQEVADAEADPDTLSLEEYERQWAEHEAKEALDWFQAKRNAAPQPRPDALAMGTTPYGEQYIVARFGATLVTRLVRDGQAEDEASGCRCLDEAKEAYTAAVEGLEIMRGA